jgi:cytoplasmic iron level regulating protein YaaA (DUF328/UPF0246 family)
MIILIHTSKTMRSVPSGAKATRAPALLDKAEELVDYVRTLSIRQVATVMSVSAPLAEKTRELFASWNTEQGRQAPAVESFLGDIYSGLQVGSFTGGHRQYADRRLRILSGLYGILRPFDGISPYRLEMGYRLPDPRYANLYKFWGSSVADQLPRTGPIVNLAANEYSKVVLGQLDPARVVTPKFLTVDPRSGEAKFVTVHAKIARGAYARWLIVTKASGTGDSLLEFADIGYEYDPARSSHREPCFVAKEFAGKGLSVRLQDGAAS